MAPMNRKLFSLNDIKYSRILLFSIILCAVTFFIDRQYDFSDPFWVSFCYGISFAVAVVWGAVNYIGHVRVNVMYQKQTDIHSYVSQLAMNQDDRLELQNYLEDYAEDLMRQGRTEEEASREAIAQFKVKELMSLSKNTMIFDLHAHYYLIGWAILAISAFIIVGIIGFSLFPTSPLLIITESILFAYSGGFIALFLIYKLLDSLISSRLK